VEYGELETYRHSTRSPRLEAARENGMVQAGVTLGAVGQAFQPDKKRVRLESLTYGRATRNCPVLNHAAKTRV